MPQAEIKIGAKLKVTHKRPVKQDPVTGLWVYETVSEEEKTNLITNTGRVQLHTQCYSATPGNAFRFIGLTNDATAPAATDSTLTGEITTAGLGRAAGTVTLASGSGTTTTIERVFTATGAISAQKAALFNAASGGVMNHVVAFTPKTLANGETLTITYTITLGA